MKTSPHHTAPARLPAINVPMGADPQVRAALEAIKERLEVREGARGNPFERAATMRDLDALRAQLLPTAAPPPDRDTAAAVPVVQHVAPLPNGVDAATLRAEIAASERRITDSLSGLMAPPGGAGYGISALEAAARSAGRGAPYTYDNLASDLASGGALIFSGAAGGTTVMELDAAGNYVLFKHRLAHTTQSVGAYTGQLRMATGLTAAGFVAGYNRRSDGDWQTSIAMDASTGNVTILGTLKAGSVIEVGSLVGPGGKTVGQLDADTVEALRIANEALAASGAYTYDTLAQDLANGGALILSGAAGGSTVMELDPLGNYVLFKHRLANPTASAGAGYAGQLRTGAGVTAAGFIAGFNRRSDNLWQTTLALDATTGNVTILGTLRAGSVIDTGATLGAGGKTVATLDTTATNALSSAGSAQGTANTALSTANSAASTASSASSTASSAYWLADSKLSSGSSYALTGTVQIPNSGGVRTGDVTWNSSSGAITGGSGIVMTGAGLIGVKNGTTTFSVTNNGDASYRGDINTGGQAYFAGQSAGAVNVGVGGSMRNIEYSTWSNAIGGSNTSVVRAGSVGYATSTSAFRAVGVVGIGTSAAGAIGIGVVGEGNLIGGYFASASATGMALQAYHPNPSGIALACNAGIIWGSYGYAVPPGTGGRFLRDDGNWAAATGAAGPQGPLGPQGPQGPQGPAGANGSGGNASSLGGYGPNDWARIFPGNTGVAYASGMGLNLMGSSSSGIAGAFVGTSAYSNVVQFDIRTTSPSDLRLKEDVQDSPYGLDFVRQLRPVQYRLKADPSHQMGFGFIAQEVELLGVGGTSLVYDDPEYRTGDVTGHKVIHYPSYVALLTKAVQELAARLETLEKNA